MDCTTKAEGCVKAEPTSLLATAADLCEKKLEDTLGITPINAPLAALLLVAAALLCAPAGHAAPPAEATMSVIVQAADVATATRLLGTVGGTVTHELGTIRAVGARLTAAQRVRLAGLQGVLRLYENGPVLVAARATCRRR